MRKTIWMLPVLCLALIAGCDTMPQSQAFVQQKNGTLVHSQSHFSFPPALAGFKRVNKIVYSSSGDDVSVGYNDDRHLIIATLYVYPTHGGSLPDEFAKRESEVSHVHQDAQLIDSGNVKVTPRHINALSSQYTFTAQFAGKKRKLRSELLVAQSGDWFVEYRFSYPVEKHSVARKRVAALERAFDWPH